jgi:YVTN family beta-propeller protein
MAANNPSSRHFGFLHLVFCLLVVVLLLCAACARRMLPPKPYLAFVATRQGDCLAVADLGNFKFVRTIPLGFVPQRVIVRPHSHEIYVTSESGEIGAVSYPDLRLSATVHVGSGHASLCFSADGGRAYEAGPGQHDILVMSGDPLQITQRYDVKPPISRLAVTPDGNTLLAESATQDRLLFLATHDGHILGSVSLGLNPGQMVILPDGAKAFIADTGQEAVSAVDISNRDMLSQIEVGSAPSLLALKPDGGEILAVSSKSSTVTLLDTSSDSVEQALPTGSNPVAAVFTADSSAVYVANAGDGTVTTLDLQNRETVASTRIGVEPVALALTPDQRFLAVADAETGSLAIMRARVPMLITTIPVGGDPSDVAVPGWLAVTRRPTQ